MTCKNLCEKFKIRMSARTGVYSKDIMVCINCGDLKGQTCFLDERGIKIINGRKYCMCCNYRVRMNPRGRKNKERFKTFKRY